MFSGQWAVCSVKYSVFSVHWLVMVAVNFVRFYIEELGTGRACVMFTGASAQAVLHCTVLYHNLLYYIILYFTVLHCISLYSILLYFIVLYCTVLYCTVL